MLTAIVPIFHMLTIVE